MPDNSYHYLRLPVYIRVEHEAVLWKIGDWGLPSRIYLPQPDFEQLLLAQVLREGDGTLKLPPRFGYASEFHQQVRANSVEEMIASQRRV